MWAFVAINGGECGQISDQSKTKGDSFNKYLVRMLCLSKQAHSVF